MITWLIDLYPQYEITYNKLTKSLNIHKPIIMSDFMTIRKCIESWELDVLYVNVGGWSDSVDYSDTGYI